MDNGAESEDLSFPVLDLDYPRATLAGGAFDGWIVLARTRMKLVQNLVQSGLGRSDQNPSQADRPGV